MFAQEGVKMNEKLLEEYREEFAKLRKQLKFINLKTYDYWKKEVGLNG
jgi:hypothetical protein